MKNRIPATIQFIGALIWFIIFAADYAYDKDLATWVYLLVSIAWWTSGIRSVIKTKTQNT